MKNLQQIKKIKQLLIALIFVLSLYFTHSSYAQNNLDLAKNSKRPLEFEQFSVEQGLSQCVVNCIIQDSFGFMWFGTDDGLNKYDGYSFTVYKHRPNDPNSLSHNIISTIYEDRAGTLWIGTFQEGLNKFNREQEIFINYRNDQNNPNSLTENTITAICESRDGTLWIGTAGGGLNKLIPGDSKDAYNFICFKNDSNNPNSLSDNYITQIYEDSSEALWIGTKHGGLNKLTSSEKKNSSPSFFHFENDPQNLTNLSHNHITSIYEDRTGTLWIGTAGGGLNKIVSNQNKPSRLTFIHYKNNPSNPNSLNNNYVATITEDLTGNLWIGTKTGGLDKLVPDESGAASPTFIHFVHDPNNPQSLSTNDIRSIYADHSGVLWIGTYGAGLNKLDPGKKQFIHYHKELNNHNSLNHNMVWAIHEDRSDILWIGTHGGGLTKFDRKKDKFTLYSLPTTDPDAVHYNKIMSIYENKTGILWLGTNEQGISKFNPKTEQFFFQQFDTTDTKNLKCNTISVFYEDQSGTLWVGTCSGRVYKYNHLTEKFADYPIGSNENSCSKEYKIRAINEDQNGFIWIGTEGSGLYKFNRKTEKSINYRANLKNPKSLSSDHVLSIHKDQSGTLWIGTYGGGLNKLIPPNENKSSPPTFVHYTEKDGLPNNVIYAILEDDIGNLWLSTNKGLSRFNPRTETFNNYNVNDGLQSNEFNSGAFFKSKSGEMFFGGINGFNSFFPQNIKDNPHVPKIVITDFMLFNKSVPIAKPVDGRTILQKSISYSEEIELSYKADVFSYEFATLHYSSPEKNEYAYKMEGFDEDWIYTDSKKRFATYTNLDPGEYIFKVKGSNNDGVWNEESKNIKVIIKPPFWEIWWFKALVILSLVLSVFFLYKRRMSKIKARKKELERQVEEKTLTTLALQNAFDEVEHLKNRLEAENVYLKDEIKLEHNFENIISRSERLKKVLHKVEQVASTDATVLILGESGTGKELLARALHNISDRGDRPLVKVNCSALPANLIESELFGHEKGAFTGATSRKIGRFELADEGTIFLDEIGDLPLELQAKLLRVLQEGEFERLGNSKTIKVNVRVIAATNRNLEVETVNRTFREDLYYRLNVFPITIPPLRERKEDIPLLVSYFIRKYEAKICKKIESIPQNVITVLQAYDWPGNVRELENIIERAVIISNGKKLSLGEWLPKTNSTINSYISTLAENERKHILKVLELTGWRVSGAKGAARILGINSKTLDSRIKKLNIIRNGNG